MERRHQEVLDKYGLKRGEAILASEKHDALYEELAKMEKAAENDQFELSLLLLVQLLEGFRHNDVRIIGSSY